MTSGRAFSSLWIPNTPKKTKTVHKQLRNQQTLIKERITITQQQQKNAIKHYRHKQNRTTFIGPSLRFERHLHRLVCDQDQPFVGYA